jgi:hypothetical protein
MRQSNANGCDLALGGAALMAEEFSRLCIEEPESLRLPVCVNFV